MKISFDIGLEDNMAFQRYYLETRNSRYRRGIQPSQIVWPAILMIFGVAMYFFDDTKYLFGGLLFVCGLAALIVLLFDKRRIFKHIREQLEDPQNILWYGRREMEFDEQGVRLTYDKGYEYSLWGVFIKIGETEDHIFLFNTSAQAHIIPKRQITQVEVEELRSLFARHIAVQSFESKNKK